MKKVLSLVLVLSMVLGSFSFAFAAPASDVVGTEYEEAVDRLGQLGVLEGYPDGTFKPANTITRAEFAAAVVRVKGLASAAEAAKGATGFTDVPAGNWAAGYVNIATKAGLVKGMGDGTFAPNAPVTYEQAVTMIVRALGYEPAAEARGGYPYGHLIIANQEGLLDRVKGTQGLPAPRGLVAQLLDNALNIELMIQVGYGTQTKWVKSGTEDTKAMYLLTELGYKDIVARVTDYDAARKLLTVGKTVLEVKDGFDFEEVKGLNVIAWYDNYENLVLLSKIDTPKFDAVVPTTTGLKLVGENKAYALAKDKDGKVDVTLTLNGKPVTFDKLEADYAKVVLDKYGDIAWVQGFTFDGNIVVEKLDGNVVESYGYEELSLKGYTIVKDGKTVKAEELEQNDIVFYNNATGIKYAVVYNNAIEGKIGKVYSDSFVFADELYEDVYLSAKYLDGETLDDLDIEAINSIKAEDEEVTVYVDFYGDIVLVVGKLEDTGVSNDYFLVIDSRKYEDSRSGGLMFTLDVLNAEGKEVNYDLSKATVTSIIKTHKGITGTYTPEDSVLFDEWEALVGINDVTAIASSRTTSNRIVRLTLNSSGKVTGVTELATVDVTTHTDGYLPTTAKYVANKFLLQGNAVVFRKDAATKYADYSVATWDKAEEEFTRVNTGLAYSEKGKDKVVAIYAATTNAKVNVATYTGLVDDVRVLKGDKVADVTMIIAGAEKEFTIAVGTESAKLVVNDIQTITVNKEDEITSVSAAEVVPGVVIERIIPGSRTLVTDNGTYYLESDHVVYYNTTPMTKQRLADIKDEDVVDLYLIDAGSKYVSYVVRGTEVKDVEKEFTIKNTSNASVVTVANSGLSTVTATVYASETIDVTTATNIVIDRTKINVLDYSVARVLSSSKSGNAITFTITFRTEDIIAGTDVLDLEAGAIQFKIGNTIYTNKAGSVDIN